VRGRALGHNRAVTEDTRPSPAAGWYADPELSGELRYWDGHAWGARFKGSWGPKVRVSRPAGRTVARLSAVLGVALGLTLVALLCQVGLAVWGLGMVGDAVARGDLDRLDTYDGADAMLSISVFCGFVATGILWMVWQHRIARSMQPRELTRGPGMHAFSWIIPVVAAWFPYQNVKELWVRLAPARSHTILGWWWAGWIVGLVLDRIFLASFNDADTVGEVKAMMVLEGISAAVGLLTAVLALRIIRTLTTGALARSAGTALSLEGPPGG
jgi:hypothetical protein